MSIHFIGIGGIGMSAVAQFFLHQGHKVTGSDLTRTKVTEMLEKKGVEVFIGEHPKHISDNLDIVIYTIAIDNENLELKEAKKRGIEIFSYPEILGVISKDKFTIAISGTHGKTTTTAMIAKILIEAGRKPTVIAGSIMSEYGSNFVYGESEYFIVEACEYKRSFLNLNPNVLVITNIDNDHLDYYKDLSDIKKAFVQLASKLKTEDFLVCDVENPNLEDVIGNKNVECNIIDYASLTTKFNLKVLGNHNVLNAKAALAAALAIEIKPDKAIKSLENFSGTWRRLEYMGKTKNGVIVYDDYAHHPTEIKASLKAIRQEFPSKKIVVIFQPHLYSRTKLLLKEFGESFKDADLVILAPIYAAREKEDKSISSEDVSKEIQKFEIKSVNLKNFPEIMNYVKNFDSETVIVTMGAGDIYQLNLQIE